MSWRSWVWVRHRVDLLKAEKGGSACQREGDRLKLGSSCATRRGNELLLGSRPLLEERYRCRARSLRLEAQLGIQRETWLKMEMGRGGSVGGSVEMDESSASSVRFKFTQTSTFI